MCTEQLGIQAMQSTVSTHRYDGTVMSFLTLIVKSCSIDTAVLYICIELFSVTSAMRAFFLIFGEKVIT